MQINTNQEPLDKVTIKTDKIADKSAYKSADKSADKSANKSANKSADKSANKSADKKRKRSQRCKHCRKKIPLIFVKCGCGDIFCLTHQSPHTHNCSHALIAKESRRDEISKCNPQIKHSTLIERI